MRPASVEGLYPVPDWPSDDDLSLSISPRQPRRATRPIWPESYPTSH